MTFNLTRNTNHDSLYCSSLYFHVKMEHKLHTLKIAKLNNIEQRGINLWNLLYIEPYCDKVVL